LSKVRGVPQRIAPGLDVAYLQRTDWWSKVDRSGGPDACWPWTQSVGSHGYGQTWDGVTVRLAHRVAWVLTYGPIPAGMTVDHDQDPCSLGKPCCNPRHLRLLSNIENATDNRQTRKTECPRGHPYDETNTYVDPKGHRRCRACGRYPYRKKQR
jgi:hypothetical protein